MVTSASFQRFQPCNHGFNTGGRRLIFLNQFGAFLAPLLLLRAKRAVFSSQQLGQGNQVVDATCQLIKLLRLIGYNVHGGLLVFPLTVRNSLRPLNFIV